MRLPAISSFGWSVVRGLVKKAFTVLSAISVAAWIVSVVDSQHHRALTFWLIIVLALLVATVFLWGLDAHLRVHTQSRAVVESPVSPGEVLSLSLAHSSAPAPAASPHSASDNDIKRPAVAKPLTDELVVELRKRLMTGQVLLKAADLPAYAQSTDIIGQWKTEVRTKRWAADLRKTINSKAPEWLQLLDSGPDLPARSEYLFSIDATTEQLAAFLKAKIRALEEMLSVSAPPVTPP